MDSTEPSADALAVADKILDEMRGGDILAVGPERSRVILARWVVKVLDGAMVAERDACAKLAEDFAATEDKSAAAATTEGWRAEAKAMAKGARMVADDIRARK